ncbi:MAG: NUDIX hydrolase [Halobacteriaceae archaeon]
MADWDIIESVTEYETGWYTGGYDLVEQPDGSRKRYYWARLPPAVVVVAVDGDDVVFVRQYRPVIRDHCLELVAGIVEPVDGREGAPPGTAPEAAYEAAANRELEEETGYRAGDTRVLATFWVATGVLRHERGIVYATDLTADGDRRTDTNEFLETVHRDPRTILDPDTDRPGNDATLEGLLLADRADLL